MKNKLELPKDGLAGLKENFSSDAVSGFIVFLLALPLSLGIAKASDFPPIMGLITAIVGGIVVSIFSGSRLTIKGPAAGLIVIVAGAVAEFGKGDNVLGWHLALGAMVVAGLVQILFGVFKLGKLMDFFPLSAVHGMLAAIGLIIIGKQIPVFLHTSVSTKGKGPLELFASIPEFVAHLDPKATVIGVVSLAIMMGWPLIKNPIIKKIPAPLVVLALAIPAELYMDFQTIAPDALVKIGSLADNIQLNASFEGLNESGIFIKFVIMFALVGSLESLLTVKAMDMLDPYKRKSDANKDLIATGIGNTVVAFLGGLPMISEVARSSANIANGAKTRWANFFHGFFILLFVLIAAKLIELIPNTALAAMLITVGIKLTHPKEFIHTLEKGKEQLLIFLVTIIFTLVEDLLVGIAAGILTEILVNIFNGNSLKAIFSAPTAVSSTDDAYLIEISDAAVFTNYLGIKRKLESIPSGFKVTIDLSKTQLVDHSVMENFEHFKHDYENDGGSVTIVGLENHKALSSHPAAARKRIKA